MAGIEAQRRLVFVKAQDLDAWRCRPLGAIDVLDLKDERVGHLDGPPSNAPPGCGRPHWRQVSKVLEF
jgi:hypothetical protein